MHISRRLAVVMTATLTVCAWSQTIGKPAPDVELKVKEQQGGATKDKFLIRDYRGRLVTMYFWRTRNVQSVELLKMMRDLEQKYRPKGVIFMDFCSDSKEKVEKFVQDEAIDTLSDHIYGLGVKRLQEMYGALSEPFVVIVDPWGILRWRGHPLDGVEERILEFLEKYPPPGGDPEWLDRHLRQAERLLDQGEIGRAYTVAKQVLDYTNEENEYHAKAESLTEKIEGAAEEWLKQAIKHEEKGEYDDAARIVAQISVRIAETDLAHDAEQEIGRMNGRRELKERIREALKQARAEVLLDEATVFEERGDYESAIEVYRRVIKKYEDTQAERTAKQALERIKNDPEVQQAIARARKQRMADRWFDLGRRCARLGLYDEARQWYEKILSEHPDTSAADKARAALRELPAVDKEQAARKQP